MRYETRKVKHKIVHVPDQELDVALKTKLRHLKIYFGKPKSQISASQRDNGLKGLLVRHRNDRFFIIVDFVHAFHQITRQMIAEVFPAVMESRFDICFVGLGGKEVIPIGFRTSSYLFEVYATKELDPRLIDWQLMYNGNITRHCDNILVTWRKDATVKLQHLKQIFEFRGLDIRLTPKSPRRWIDQPIRFCGITIPRKGKPHISRRKAKDIMQRAKDKSSCAIKGASEFLQSWS